MIWENHGFTYREQPAFFADLGSPEVALAEVVLHVQWKELGELDVNYQAEVADKRVEQYSKGMKQRLPIVRGLINDPRCIFVDEPTIGLDAPIAREIRRFIKEKLNRTTLFTTHYLEEAEELCDEVVIIHKGEIVEQGTPNELKRKYRKGHSLAITVHSKSEVVGQILQNACQAHSVAISAKIVEEGYRIRIDTVQNVTAQLVDALTTANQQILELRSVEPSLEDVLVAVCGGEAE